MSWAPDRQLQLAAPHFATGPQYVNLAALPDPDLVLRRAGKTVAALRELLIDPHLSSQWDVRLSAVSGFDLDLFPGDESEAATRALEFVRETTAGWAWHLIAEKVSYAVAYGYQPFELIWVADGGRWVIEDIVDKPPEWFVSRDHQWWYLAGYARRELPPGRFAFATHKASYENPYGVKLFSRVFWPVTIKRNGLAWWTKWIEKYGSVFLVGKHPPNAGDADKSAMLQALEELVNSAVATMPDDSTVQALESAQKTQSSNAHKTFADHLNGEISKAILGQSGTSELGANGSYAALQVLNLVRQDLARADRRRVTTFLNRILADLVMVNFGADTPAPRVSYRLPEDLQHDRVERDAKLFTFGTVKPTVQYYVDQYGFDPSHVSDIVGASEPAALASSLSEDDTDPAPPDTPRKRGLFAGLRADAADRRRQRAKIRLFDEWQSDERLRSEQAEVDEVVEHYLAQLADAEDYQDALDTIVAAASNAPLTSVARRVVDATWIGGNAGGHHA